METSNKRPAAAEEEHQPPSKRAKPEDIELVKVLCVQGNTEDGEGEGEIFSFEVPLQGFAEAFAEELRGLIAKYKADPEKKPMQIRQVMTKKLAAMFYEIIQDGINIKLDEDTKLTPAEADIYLLVNEWVCAYDTAFFESGQTEMFWKRMRKYKCDAEEESLSSEEDDDESEEESSSSDEVEEESSSSSSEEEEEEGDK